MAIRKSFNGMTIYKPGKYWPSTSWRIRHDLLSLLAKLGIKSARRRRRHPYENVDRDEEER